MADPQRWNPRYVAYATAHGRTPAAMLEQDRDAWPGGQMTGFIRWMSRAWRTWATSAGHPRRVDPCAYVSPSDHAAFDAWLATEPGELAAT